VARLLDPESYCLLQARLAATPRAGSVIPGTGSLRKIRWRGSGRGKRGGVRVIYYWAASDSVLLMLFAYPKGERDDLTPTQRRTLAAVVREEFQ